MNPNSLPDNQLQNASRRLKDGYTRFHASIRKGYDHLELQKWVASGVAPWNRNSTQGRPPFLDFLPTFFSALREKGKSPGAAPHWWIDRRHTENGTQESWEAWQKEIDLRKIETNQALLDGFLSNVDWNLWKAEQLIEVKKTLSHQGEIDRAVWLELIDKLEASGFSFAPAKWEDIPVTTAMWQLTRAMGAKEAGHWITRGPIDPPGAGPGILSMLIARLETEPTDIEALLPLAKIAIERGASLGRPTFSMKKPDETKRWQLCDLLKSNLSPASTLLGQAQAALNHYSMTPEHKAMAGEIMEVLVQHPEIDEQGRAEAFLALIRQTPKWNPQDPKNPENIRQALGLLLDRLPTEMPVEWSRLFDSMRSYFVEKIATRTPVSLFPEIRILNERIYSLAHTHTTNARAIHDHFKEILENLPLQDCKWWMENVIENGHYHANPKQARQIILMELLSQLTGGSKDIIQIDKCAELIKHNLAHIELTPEQSSEISRKIFKHIPLNGLPWIYQDHILDHLEKSGYAPEPNCWSLLASRLRGNKDSAISVADSPHIIENLAQYLVKCQIAPPSEVIAELARQPLPPKDSPNFGYTTTGSWSRPEAEQCQLQVFQHLLPLLTEPNEREGGRSCLQRLAIFMRSNPLDDDDCQKIESIIKGLIVAGANPMLETLKEDEAPWIGQMNDDHPYWIISSQIELDLLEQSTKPATGNRKPMRI